MRGLLGGSRPAGGLDFRACEYFVGTSAGLDRGAPRWRRPAARGGRSRRRAWAADAAEEREASALRRVAARSRDTAAAARHWRRWRSPRSRPPAGPCARPRSPRRRGRSGDSTASRATSTRSARCSTAGCGSRRSTAAAAAACCSARPARRRHASRGRARLVRRAMAVRAGRDRRPRVRRRRRLEPDQPRRRARPAAAPACCASSRRPSAVRCGRSRAPRGARGDGAARPRVRVRTLVPDAAAAAAIGPNLMDASRVEEVARRGIRPGPRLAGAIR